MSRILLIVLLGALAISIVGHIIFAFVVT